jgi:hypothetical protein
VVRRYTGKSCLTTRSRLAQGCIIGPWTVLVLPVAGKPFSNDAVSFVIDLCCPARLQDLSASTAEPSIWARSRCTASMLQLYIRCINTNTARSHTSDYNPALVPSTGRAVAGQSDFETFATRVPV